MALPPFLSGLEPTLHVAHRGGAALAPENTLVAFRSAVRDFRTDMLELDVQVTRDGVLVVAHDPTLERVTDGEGPIAGHLFAEIERLDAGHRFTRDGVTFPFRGRGVRMPRFEEVLREFPELRLNVELKPESAGAVDLFARMLRDEGAVARVCCGSESDEVAARLHEALPEACHFYPRDALASFVLAVNAGESPPLDDRFRVLDMPLHFGDVRLAGADFVRRAAELGRWVNVWTVDDPAEMRRCIEDRVGGVMTDRPDLLRQELGRAVRAT